ncbi:MAG TPA: NfeD family protein [Mycobacteriales bacterium]|nr:NfeD family protein [Mycobacteriales bacterium]
MEDWLAWLIAAVVLAIAEVLTLTLVLGMLSGGAAAAAIVAALGGNEAWQAATFVVVSAVLLATVLPAARRHRQKPSSTKTGTERLIGTRAITLSDVNTAKGGLVRIGGETWTARPYDVNASIPAGQWVEVRAIDGVTAVVHPSTAPDDGAQIGAVS